MLTRVYFSILSDDALCWRKCMILRELDRILAGFVFVRTSTGLYVRHRPYEGSISTSHSLQSSSSIQSIEGQNGLIRFPRTTPPPQAKPTMTTETPLGTSICNFLNTSMNQDPEICRNKKSKIICAKGLLAGWFSSCSTVSWWNGWVAQFRQGALPRWIYNSPRGHTAGCRPGSL